MVINYGCLLVWNNYCSFINKDYTGNLIVYFRSFKFPKPRHLSSNLDAEKSTTHSLLKKNFQTYREDT
jgi:hypothetical protein